MPDALDVVVVLQQLQQLNKRPNDETYDTTVRSSAESLVDLFHSYSEALTKVKDNQLKDLQGDVKTVNTILTKIRDLNVQIRDSGIYKDKALELRDQRNVLIDELSKYMKIDVRYSMEKMDDFSEIEKLTITLADSGTPPIELINGIYGTQLTMPVETLARNPEYDKNDPRGMKYLDDGSVFLNLWKCNVFGLTTKVNEIYDEYFRETGAVRRYLNNNYGVSFEDMRADRKTFLKPKCSLRKFCRDRGLLGGLQDWIGFRTNNIRWDK